MKSTVYNAARGDVLLLFADTDNEDDYNRAVRTAHEVRDFMGQDSRVVVLPDTARVYQPSDFLPNRPEDEQSRHAVLVHVGLYEFMDLFTAHRRMAQDRFYAAVEYKRNFPEDARLDGIGFDPCYNRIALRFSHPSFAAVPDGAFPPDFEDDFAVKRVALVEPGRPDADSAEVRGG